MHRENTERFVSDHAGEDGRRGRVAVEFLHLHVPGAFINAGTREVDVPSTRSAIPDPCCVRAWTVAEIELH